MTVHVLLVEDEPDQRRLCKALLEEMGCRVDVAVDGGAAISRVGALNPDVVIMDIGLPMIDGCEAIRRIRQDSSSRPFIVAVTGFDDGRRRRTAMAAGCDEYLVKPIHDQLRRIVESLAKK